MCTSTDKPAGVVAGLMSRSEPCAGIVYGTVDSGEARESLAEKSNIFGVAGSGGATLRYAVAG